MGAAVELIGVSKSYRRGDEFVHALRRVSFTLARAEAVALVGPSGCGTSTTLNLVAGVDRPDEGAVLVAGTDLACAGTTLRPKQPPQPPERTGV